MQAARRWSHGACGEIVARMRSGKGEKGEGRGERERGVSAPLPVGSSGLELCVTFPLPHHFVPGVCVTLARLHHFAAAGGASWRDAWTTFDARLSRCRAVVV